MTTLLAYTVALPALVSVKRYGTADKAVSWLFITGLAAEILATILKLTDHNNMVVFYAFTIVEAAFVLKFANNYLKDRIVYPILPIIIGAVTVIEFCFNPLGYNSVSATLEYVAIVPILAWVVSKVYDGMYISDKNYMLIGIMLFYYVLSFVYLAALGILSLEAAIFMSKLHAVLNALFNLGAGLILWNPKVL